jgi:hypothetical protein
MRRCVASIPASAMQTPVRHLVLCPCGRVNDPQLPGYRVGSEYEDETDGANPDDFFVYDDEHMFYEDERVQEEEEEYVYEGEYEGSDRVVLGVSSVDDDGNGEDETDEMNPAEEVGVAAAAPPPATARRGRRRTTAASVKLFGRYDLNLDILEMIFELLEPRDLTTLLCLSKLWYGKRDDMHSWLLKQFRGLDERVRAGFKPLPPPSVLQTFAGPVCLDGCSCRPRFSNVDPALASLPRLAAAVTTLQRALSTKSVRLHLKGLNARRYSFQGLSLGQESALRCITVGDVHLLAKWWEGGGSLAMFEGSRGIQMRHLDAPLITYLREDESRVEFSLPVNSAQSFCVTHSAPRWTPPTAGSVRPEDRDQNHHPTLLFGASGDGFLHQVPGSVALRIQEAGLPLPTSRFVLTDEFILWAESF